MQAKVNQSMPNQTGKMQGEHAASRRLAGLAIPTICYVLVASVVLGTIAYVSSGNMISDQPNKDIWQHLATLLALMDNLGDPQNPFVPTQETSRHFHPLWVATAAIAQLLGVSAWGALTAATYLSMAFFGVAVFVFANTYFRSAWAPLVLLGVLLFGWAFDVQHTGLTSFRTLLYAAVYPATFMISLSLLLWALVIRALDGANVLLWIMLLVAFGFATHQLGAVIGLIAVGCLVLLWPGAEQKARLSVCVAVMLGLVIALFWPYHNPLLLTLQSGNSTWGGAEIFYSRAFMTLPFLPAIVGVLGLTGPRARPFVLALVIYYGLYLLGLTGLHVAARFMMPALLVLHIGLAGYLLRLFQQRRLSHKGRAAVTGLSIAAMAAAFVYLLTDYQRKHDAASLMSPDVYGAAQRLTADIPDAEPVAAFGLSAWPVVGTGQRVLSVPWPEPGIHDLSERQAATRSLFSQTLSTEERRELAQALGVRTLIAQWWPARDAAFAVLSGQAVETTQEGNMWRFDLFE